MFPLSPEFNQNATVQPDAERHVVHVRTDLFAEVGDLVDEGDLGSQESVAGIREVEARLTQARSGVFLKYNGSILSW